MSGFRNRRSEYGGNALALAGVALLLVVAAALAGLAILGGRLTPTITHVEQIIPDDRLGR